MNSFLVKEDEIINFADQKQWWYIGKSTDCYSMPCLNFECKIAPNRKSLLSVNTLLAGQEPSGAYMIGNINFKLS